MSYQIREQESHLQLGRGIDADKIQELEEKVEFLQEQIESFKQYLCHKDYELQQLKQELSYTNKELCAALNQKPLTIDEAIELTKNLLASEKLSENVLVELLIAINSSWCVSSNRHFSSAAMQSQ